MAGLLSGLGKFGLKNLEETDLYETEASKKAKEAQNSEQKAQGPREEEFLFDKTYECPICDAKITARTVKASRARMIRADADLRPVYENIEPIKYDVIVCPYCGYAALTRYFGHLMPSQVKAIKEKISSSYEPSMISKSEIYTYEEALDHYQLALANAIVKSAKASEKAYICLKTAWLLRSMREQMQAVGAFEDAKLKESMEQEKEYLKNALEGFITARQTEDYPMCGMDENTIEYLIARLAMEDGQYDVASRLIANLLANPSVSPRMKDKARDAKDELLALKKDKK